MSKIAQYLQEHLVGEVITSTTARKYFSTDGGVFEVMPSMIVYPENENDVRKTAKFSWQLAERGRMLPITARGRGSDQGGAAIGPGIILVFPAHMDKLLEFDSRHGVVVVEPGLIYRNLQDTLKTHGYFLPPYPSSIDYATLGGAIANNTAGERTVKYGDTRGYTQALRVVLANGEVIETRPLSKRELNKKKGQTNFEGEIYRELDDLLTNNAQLIAEMQPRTSKNSAGYYLSHVRQKHGGFDLTPLFVGSQGTLGILTAATMKVVPNNTHRTLTVIGFDNIDDADKVVADIRKLEPAAIEMVDRFLLEFIHDHNPNQLKNLIEPPYPAIVLLVEFDDAKKGIQHRQTKRLRKLVKQYTSNIETTSDYTKRDELWKIRHASAALVAHVSGAQKALPIIEDGVVPIGRFKEFIEKVYELFDKYHLRAAVWGHAADANLHIQPFLDLSQVADRQTVFKIMDEYYKMVIDMGGSTTAEHNDGRLRAVYLKELFGDEIYEIFERVKDIFDPHGILNPGVKIGVTREKQIDQLRHEYNLDHLADHLPRT